MTTSEALASLKLRGSVQGSESDLTDPLLNEKIQEAVSEHNASFATIADVPSREIEAVMLLALQRLQLQRAVNFSRQSNLKGSEGFGTDRNTPYYKCIDSANLFRKQYETLVARLGVDASNTVVVSTVVKKSMLYDRFMESGQTPKLPEITLSRHASSEDESTGTTYTLEWELSREVSTEFFEFKLFHIAGSSPIFESWNYESTAGIPFINNGSKLLVTIDNPSFMAAKATGMVKTTGTINRFLLVFISRTNDYKFSNELVLTSP